MSMRQESERGYIVRMSASASINIEVACTAIDGDAAEAHAESVSDELAEFLQGMVDDLISLHPEALRAYIEGMRARGEGPPLNIVKADVSYHTDDALEVDEVDEGEDPTEDE